jgi:putative DNA modification/repair radical SAM protein
MTNICVYDCAYCVNRISNDVPRTTFSPQEIVELTLSFYRRNYIEGLFLSSAVLKNPDYTMELMLKTIKILREDYRFNGYIHIKAIPGASPVIIGKAGRFADRMSVNIELPSNEGLKLLAPQKKKKDILNPMGFIKDRIIENSENGKRVKSRSTFAPAGQSTQLIIGATPDSDLKIIRLSESLYNRYKLRRIFYSAYVPVSNHPALIGVKRPELLREHRLYQADWLLRFYGFSAQELLDEKNSSFDIMLDPKCQWAVNNLRCFPIEVNKADYRTLLRVPGIGVRSAGRIITSRKEQSLDFDNLKKLGVVLKRAVYFITCRGRYYKGIRMDERFIKDSLTADMTGGSREDTGYRQMSILDAVLYNQSISASTLSSTPCSMNQLRELKLISPSPADHFKSLTGEI